VPAVLGALLAGADAKSDVPLLQATNTMDIAMAPRTLNRLCIAATPKSTEKQTRLGVCSRNCF
jgi:hypothetical protein